MCSNTPNNCPHDHNSFYIILNDVYVNIKCRKFTAMGRFRGMIQYKINSYNVNMNIKVCKYDVETLLFCETALQQFVL